MEIKYIQDTSVSFSLNRETALIEKCKLMNFNLCCSTFLLFPLKDLCMQVCLYSNPIKVEFAQTENVMYVVKLQLPLVFICCTLNGGNFLF